MLVAAGLQASGPAALKCLEVDINGGVTLYWAPVSDPAGFISYTIYFSNNGSNFSVLTTLFDPAADQYFHAGADANLAKRYYYIQTRYDDDSPVSDTLHTLFLQLDNHVPDYNRADLYWNAPHNPLPDGSSGWYKIYRESPPGNWVLADSVSTENLFYSRPEIVCLDSISYRIELDNAGGCRSVSNVQGATFKDTGYPEKPVFDSVSINADENAVLGWEPSVSEDVDGYIIYREENGTWIEIDRIVGRDSTFYIDTIATPCLESISFAIASVDSCGNKSPGTFQQPLNTIFLNDISYDVCSTANTLSWTAYLNAFPRLDGYNIFCSRDGGPFELVGQTNPGDTTFVHDSLVAGSEYVYFVQAFFEKGTSSSCRKKITATGYAKPAFIYLVNADVLPDNRVELTADVDTVPEHCTWQIWRSAPNGGNLQIIASIDRNEMTGFPLTYIDETADASEGFYNYSINVLDSCKNNSLESNPVTTVFLKGNSTDNVHNFLQWSDYKGWYAGVGQYYIFRMVNGVEPDLPIDSVDAQTLEYTDDISSVVNPEGQIIYWVQAMEKPGDEFGYREKARSNRIGTAPEADLFVPNAFRPDGLTTEFKPVFSFFGGTNYSFRIFNRWGRLIFETSDPYHGWNGRFKGNPVPQGVYVYKIVYENPDRSSVKKQGTVTVIY